MKFTYNQKIILGTQAVYSMYSALTMSLVIPFALVLGASNFAIGVLSAAQFLAIFLAQIPGERAVEKIGRKAVFMMSTPLARLCWAVILFLPFYFKNSLAILIVFFFLVNFLEYFAEPGYLSMISDAVPTKIRGWFFSKKSAVKMFFNTSFFFVAGYFLDFFPRESPNGFVIVMSLGMVLGIISTIIMSRIKQPNRISKSHRIGDYFKIHGNLKKFVIFVMVFNFAVYLSGPFFAVYLLENLKLSYVAYAGLTVISVVVRIIAQQHYGKITDKYGDRNVALLVVIGTAIFPLLFLFVTPSTLWIAVIAFVIAGFTWAGVDLAIFNMVLDLTNRKERSFQLSAYILFTSLPVIIAPLLGGWIADNVSFVLAGLPLVFFISALLRAASAIFLIPIPESRVKTHYSLGTVFRRIVEVYPEEGLRSIIRYVKERNGKH